MRLVIACVSLLVLNCSVASSLRAQAISGATIGATLGAPYVISEGSQLHTNQIFGPAPAALLDEIDAAAKRLSGRVVKLHIAAKDNATVEAVATEIKQRYAKALPAVTCVVGKLGWPDANLGVDAVITFKGSPKDGVQVEEDSFGRILHPGSRVYVSGQAEKDKTDIGATLGTLQSLSDTLETVKANLDDVVQVKAFLNPIRADKRVRAEIASFFGERKVPVVIVEWISQVPIEIELIAACPAGMTKSGIEYITPGSMTASPLYARIAKLNSPETIYIAGFTARGNDPLGPDAEVKDIFASIQEVLKQTGSDLENMAKATYYCSIEETSRAINSLRPNYYNPSRPPAASKAIVGGVGRDKRFCTIDMIAVPR